MELFTKEMAENGMLPKVGFQLKFYFDYDDEKFGYLQREHYGWDDGDDLEVVKVIRNEHASDIAVVLNTMSDVLTTATIGNPMFFIKPKTKEELEIDSIAMIINQYNSAVTGLYKGIAEFKGEAKALYDAGYRKVK